MGLPGREVFSIERSILRVELPLAGLNCEAKSRIRSWKTKSRAEARHLHLHATSGSLWVSVTVGRDDPRRAA